MSVAQTLQVVEIVRAFGVPVTFERGWDTRGNGQTSAYQGGIIHHTGGSYAVTCPAILIEGRSDLDGPLCNFAGLRDGGLHVVAAHPANHAGASGGAGTWPFPVTTLFNKLVMGLEICYPGSQPMTEQQFRTAAVFAKAMELMFGTVERARLHAETSREGKWDAGWSPGRSISGAQLRARAAALQLEVDDMYTDNDRRRDEHAAWRLKSFLDVVSPTINDPNAPQPPEKVQAAIDLNKAKWYGHALLHLEEVGSADRVKDEQFPFVTAFKEMAETVRQLADDMAALKTAVGVAPEETEK